MSRYESSYDPSITEQHTPSESFVVFGTVFPEQTERDRRAGVSDSGQFIPVWKQEVRDEKGRRRFHGAFTGGFSAGYYNTVGSKEGWTPSSFVSSRSARSEKREARPEDFMDEEDLQELANARKLVATEEFDILGGTQRELEAKRQQQQQDEARGGVGFLGVSLMDVIQPTRDSVGIRLLRKLGWKPGQGIGPRMTRRQRREATADEDGEEDDDDDMHMDITFAPRDTPIMNFSAKTNVFGLGYELEKNVPQVAEMRRLRQLKNERDLLEQEEERLASAGTKRRAAFGISEELSSRSAGFGLGAFEDEDDDVDVYGDSSSSMKQYHHTLYEDEYDESHYHREERASKKQRYGKEPAEERYREEETNVNKARCSDGRLPLKGFVLPQEPQELGKWYRPPEVPESFNEIHIFEGDSASTPVSEPRHNMTFEERGAILGEKPIEARSVFDYIPQKSRDRLDSVLQFVTGGNRNRDYSKLSDFPRISKQQANLALKGFMPFGDNPKKQRRYRQYLENMAGLLSEDGEPKETLPIPEGLTYDEAMKEIDEFAQAARIFRPISAMMSGRFTSSSFSSGNFEQTTFEGGLKTEEQWRKEKEIKDKQEAAVQPAKAPSSQEAEAAAMKMFGQLTRTVKPFYPARLVCKRFNVRNPHPNHVPSDADGSGGRTQAGSKEALSEEAVEDMLRARGKTSVTDRWANDPALNAVIPKPSERAKAIEAPPPSISKQDTQQPTATPEKEKQDQQEQEREEPETTSLNYERPFMDIFKAIFENSEDEEDEDEEEEQKEKGGQEDVPPNAESQGVGMSARGGGGGANTASKAATAAADESKLATVAPIAEVRDEETDGNMIGPLPPPAEPFRPKFTRPREQAQNQAQERHVGETLEIMSEKVIVEPFKPRTQSKRRRVSVSDDESDSSQEEEEEEERSSSKRKKSSKKKRKRSTSRERHHRSSKKEKKKKDKKRKHRHRRRSYTDESEQEEQGVWVEKEPVVTASSTTATSAKDAAAAAAGYRSRRPRAEDLW